jgi:NadR type nicotinamide-nucleotide adenylyltransferase
MEKALKQQPSNCLKVVLFGPESTGKTTLAKQLADYFNTLWVPEYMREYLQKKWDDKKEKCTKEDLTPIAVGQMTAENKAASRANNVLFCDTNLLEIKVYSEYYYNGFCPSEIKEYALKNTYDIYFLTYIDTKWQFDDLRDRPVDREKMFCIFESQLINQKLQFEVLQGNQDKRFDFAVKIIERLLKEKRNVNEE